MLPLSYKIILVWAAQFPAQKRSHNSVVIGALGRSNLLATQGLLDHKEAICILRLHQQKMLRVKRGLPSITVCCVPRQLPSTITSCKCIAHGRSNDAVSAPAQLPRHRVGFWTRGGNNAVFKTPPGQHPRACRGLCLCYSRGDWAAMQPSGSAPISLPQHCDEHYRGGKDFAHLGYNQ